MLKLILLLIVSFGTALHTFAQQEVIISNEQNCKVSYKTKKISEGSKDKWLITATVTNISDAPLYYAVETTKQPDGTIGVNSLSNQGFAKLLVKNVTGFLANNTIQLKGEITSLFTTNKANVLYQILPDKIYNFEGNVNLKTGDTPIVVFSNNYTLKTIGEFNITTTASMIDGNYKISCGNAIFAVMLQEQNGKTVLVQVINGKQIRWNRVSSTQFVKETDSSTTLLFNTSKRSFYYNNADGAVCEWMRL